MAEPSNTTTIPGNKGCVSCGASNPPSARFCAQCAASLPAPVGADNSKASSLIQDARQHLTLQHFEEAALAAEAALVLDSNSAEAHHLAAQARLKQGMRASAARHAEKAVQLDTSNPEYHATLIATQSPVSSGSFDWNRPGVIASAVAAAVILLVVVISLSVLAAKNARENAQDTMQASTPTGPASQYAPLQDSAGPYPQPIRPAASQAGKPRIPARASAPGPMDLSGDGPYPTTTIAGGGVSGMPNYGPSGAVALAPAPVDSTALSRFPAPEAVAVAPRRTTQSQPSVTPQVVVPPAPQPGGGTLFGGTGFGPAAGSTQPQTAPSEPAETAPTARPAPTPPSSPQQAYVQRDYAAAIGGYLKRISNGEATGSNYLQLGLAYERVGDRREALASYNAAIRSYQAQISAGIDVDVATRGLKTTQRALVMLESR